MPAVFRPTSPAPRRLLPIALAVLVLGGCSLWAEEPAPRTGLALETGAPSVASFPLVDGDPASGEVRVAPRGLTASLNTWGKGARFHVTMQIVNDSDEPVRLDPYQARVRDLGNVEIRLLELRVGDGAPKIVEVAPGEDAVVDLLFGGTILRGPMRWERFKLNWIYTVGDLEQARAAVYDEVEGAGGPDPGPWLWAPDADPGHAPVRSPRWEHGPNAE